MQRLLRFFREQFIKVAYHLECCTSWFHGSMLDSFYLWTNFWVNGVDAIIRVLGIVLAIHLLVMICNVICRAWFLHWGHKWWLPHFWPNSVFLNPKKQFQNSQKQLKSTLIQTKSGKFVTAHKQGVIVRFDFWNSRVK